MVIKSAVFVISSTQISKCPEPKMPEYAFIGRSNVGKSSLINMLVQHKNLAKTSGKPGKTQLINHFLINEKWYLADLPGFGYAKVSKEKKLQWDKMIRDYLLHRENLLCVFVLIDSRLEMQKIDRELMDFLGENQIPFSIIFTKIDKLSPLMLQKNIAAFRKEMRLTWDELPEMFNSSAETKTGREKILDFIEETNKIFKSPAYQK